MWLAIRKFAESQGISREAVHSRISSGSIKAKKINGRWLVEVPDPVEDGEQEQPVEEQGKTALESRWDVENELKRVKILNVKSDIILKRQKSKDYVERKRVEFCEGVLEAFTDSFSDLKGVVVDLKLKKEQIRKFRETYAKCLKKFEEELTKYLKKKDLEEEKENEVTA